VVIGAWVAAVELRMLDVVARVIELVVDAAAVAVSLVVVKVGMVDWLVVVLVVVTVVVSVAIELFDWLVVAVLVKISVSLLVSSVEPVPVVPVVAVCLRVPFLTLVNVSIRVRVDIRGNDDVRVVEETAVVHWNCVPGVAMQIWLYSVLLTLLEASGPLPELAALVPSQRLSSAFRTPLCCKSSTWIW
jgi:hypothetical protein